MDKYVVFARNYGDAALQVAEHTNSAIKALITFVRACAKYEYVEVSVVRK